MVAVPRMITELKQGTGRLIRTASYRGVMAILDPRIRSAQYGRNKVLPALPPAELVSRGEAVQMFFGVLKPWAPTEPPPVAAVPAASKAKAKKSAAVTLVDEEIPF